MPRTYQQRKKVRLEAGKCLHCGRDRDRTSLRCSVCHEKMLVRQRNRAAKMWLAVLERLGGACFCCGETEPLFLTIDHPYNDGNLHRNPSMGGRGNLRAAFQGADVQLACWNCNCGRARNDGVCPHKAKEYVK